MIEISVLYSDLSIQRSSWEDIQELQKDRVLFISARDDEIDGKQGNAGAVHGFDKYAVCYRRHEDKDWIMLLGWDYDDFVWRQVSCQGCNDREVVDMPLGVLHVAFTGQSVSPKKWEKAEKKFNKEMQ